MLRVEIHAPSQASWVDHLGNKIDKLVFSKKYEPNYIKGHYPLESFGSVYRNIDNFCESPLQSRTDWEIRIPMMYSSPDGSFKTIDLLYWLEDVNERHKLEFDLLGCEVFLKDENGIIYSGVVESTQSGDGATSIRISDWLGNPKVSKSDFPVSIGVAAPAMWKPVITKHDGYFEIEVSKTPLQKYPDFFIKIGEKYLNIYGFHSRGRSRYIQPQYFDSNRKVRISIAEKVTPVYTLPEDMGPDDDILVPAATGFSFLVDRSSDASVRYSLGDGGNLETIDAWAGGYWLSPANLLIEYPWSAGGNLSYLDGYSLGRAERGSRRSHVKGEAILKIEEISELDVQVVSFFRAESVIAFANGYRAPFMKGSPAQLAANSERVIRSAAEIDWTQCPEFLPVSSYLAENERIEDHEHKNPEITSLYPRSNQLYIIVTMVNADGVEIPDSAMIRSGDITVGLKSAVKHPLRYSLFGSNLPNDISEGYLVKESPQNFPVSGWRNFTLWFQLLSGEGKGDELKSVDTIQVGYIRARAIIQLPLDVKNLYVSCSTEPESMSCDPETGSQVNPVIEKLLSMGNVSGEVSGENDNLHYGAIIKSEAFALRDKLRSLAAESATLIRFSPQKRKIITSDVSLENESLPLRIPLSAFLLDNNIYSFKMESPEKNELLSGVDINWGKDFETGKYAHTLSVVPSRIEWDGARALRVNISREKWNAVFKKIAQNSNRGVGTVKSVDSEWITSWEAAEKFAYNLLRWNSARLRKANARLIFSVLDSLEKRVDIGDFVSFNLPGYPSKFSETTWVVIGRHDDLDGMVTTLELLETPGLAAPSPNGYLLLENGGNLLYEDGGKIKLEDFYG